MDNMLLGLCAGVGLAAACGFRVFVPLFVISLGASTGHMEVASEFGWIASPIATVAFLIATVLEIAAYYVPAVDNLLDTIASPAAVIAGTVVTAACISDMSPFMQWTLATIAGGGTAATVQGMTALTRTVSTATTGGFGNPVVSTAEASGATLMAGMAVFAPIIAALLAIAIVVWAVKRIVRLIRKIRNRGKKKTEPETQPVPAAATPAATPAPQPEPAPAIAAPAPKPDPTPPPYI